jgi:thymidylate kinase
MSESLTGHALACLYAADRYHHLQTEIRPRMEYGEMVITDRYVPSGLVMQRFDGIDPAFLWQLNSEADRPDLEVVMLRSISTGRPRKDWYRLVSTCFAWIVISSLLTSRRHSFAISS